MHLKFPEHMKKKILSVRRKDLSVWDVVNQEWVVPNGTFTAHVGSWSKILLLMGTFTMQGIVLSTIRTIYMAFEALFKSVVVQAQDTEEEGGGVPQQSLFFCTCTMPLSAN
jgi:hypothetical protein